MTLQSRGPIPFQPEPLAAMQARFHAAYEPIWPYVPPDHDGDAPGFHREHVFDFEDGVRMIISRVRSKRGDAVGVLVCACAQFPRKDGRQWQVDALLDRYLDIMGAVTAEVDQHGLGGGGRTAWWVMKEMQETRG